MSDEKESESSETSTSSESEGAEKPADNARPEAILARLSALGDEDPEERKSQEEERKLAERKAASSPKKGGPKKGKGGGLEVAASKKLSKIGTRAEPRRSVAVAASAAPLVDKTVKFGEWAQKNQKLLIGGGAAIAIGLSAIAFYVHHTHKREVEASALLAKAVQADRGYVAEPPKDADPELLAAVGPFFKTYDERADAALAKYRDVEAQFPKSGASMLAKLAEGSLLLDKHDADGAIAAFVEAGASPLAAADKEVKGRALEGLGFAYELKALAMPAESAKFYDEAMKAYKELENVVDADGFRELASYHQARVFEAKGDKAKAKELLVALVTKLDKPANLLVPSEFVYLKQVASDRLRAIDPSALPKPSLPGQNGAIPEELRKMLQERMQQQGQGAGGEGP